jgi:hypothetical protein
MAKIEDKTPESENSTMDVSTPPANDGKNESPAQPVEADSGVPAQDPMTVAHGALVGSGHWGRDEAAKIIRYLVDAGIEFVHHPRS